MKKFNIIISMIAVVFYTLISPISALAQTNNEDTESFDKEFRIAYLESEDLISVFDSIEAEKITFNLLNGTLIELKEEDENYSLVEFVISNEELIEYNEHAELDEVWQGYVQNDALISEDEYEEILLEDSNKELNEDNKEDETNSDLPNENQVVENNEYDENKESLEELNEEEAVETETNEVEESVDYPQEVVTFSSRSSLLKGVVKKSPTNIREKTSTKSKVIKKYPIGSVIQYEPYAKNWFRTTVTINGKNQYGYIHKKHVTTVKTKPENLKGVAKKKKTNIRAGASTKSKVIKSYPIGQVLTYKTFSKNWNEITVNVNGKKVTGYLHKKHVTNVKTKPKKLKGVVKKSPTNIRAGASTKSKVIKKYPIGHVLQYKTFSKNWNEVQINGSTVGYLHKKHVTNVKTKPKDQKTVTVKNPTNVRKGASLKSEVLTKIPLGTIIDVKTFSKNWFSYTTKVNGHTQTGYIHRKHIGDKAVKNTKYNITLDQALNIQMSKLRIESAPKTMYVEKKALKRVKGDWAIDGSKEWPVRSKAGSKNKVIGYIANGKTTAKINVDEVNSTKNYYKISTPWIIPTKEKTKKYLNPANFKVNTPEYFQFLVLSQRAGTNAKELNEKILKGKGVLSGKGSSFVDAAKKYKINELYLISHAELETGNGSSTLAKGVKVGKAKDGKVTLVTDKNKSKLKNIKTVYNMYGIGAVDGDALRGGAIRAYNLGWTSVSKAIKGGAKFVAEDYIAPGGVRHSGQNTLYKMRWHPEGMAEDGNGSWHQYATDIQWATKQTIKLNNYYKLLDNYTLIFDVPTYK